MVLIKLVWTFFLITYISPDIGPYHIEGSIPNSKVASCVRNFRFNLLIGEDASKTQ